MIYFQAGYRFRQYYKVKLHYITHISVDLSLFTHKFSSNTQRDTVLLLCLICLLISQQCDISLYVARAMLVAHVQSSATLHV